MDIEKAGNATSSIEAEFMAAAECCKDVRYMRMLIEEITEEKVQIKLKIDNHDAILLIKSGAINKRSKYINIKYRHVNEVAKTDCVNIEYCPTNDQVADILTKPLNLFKFKNCKAFLMINK